MFSTQPSSSPPRRLARSDIRKALIRPTGRIGADQHGALTISLAIVLAAVIYAGRDAFPNPNEGLTHLYSLPIAIVAVRFGAVGGVIAAVASLALFAVWDISDADVHVGPAGYLSRGSAFLLLGLIVGRFSSERRLLVARLDKLATGDPLTGLANRAKLELELTAQLRTARRQDRPGMILLADLDGFKAINDTHGHSAGDKVLRAVADTLRAEVRADDVVARIGGDEFVVVLPDTPPEVGEAVARAMSEAIGRRVREVDGSPVAVGVSIGCVAFGRKAQDGPDELLNAADEAMYRVKRARRDRRRRAGKVAGASGGAEARRLRPVGGRSR